MTSASIRMLFKRFSWHVFCSCHSENTFFCSCHSAPKWPRAEYTIKFYPPPQNDFSASAQSSFCACVPGPQLDDGVTEGSRIALEADGGCVLRHGRLGELLEVARRDLPFPPHSTSDATVRHYAPLRFRVVLRLSKRRETMKGMRVAVSLGECCSFPSSRTLPLSASPRLPSLRHHAPLGSPQAGASSVQVRSCRPSARESRLECPH